MKIISIILFFLIFFSFVFTGCLPIVPTEEEPEPADRVVLVELYMTLGCPACEIVEPILEQLVKEYGYEQLVLAEQAGWGDYSTEEISDRYKWYFPNFSDRSVPNILFDGMNDRIHGASNYQQIKNKIDAELKKGSKIIITASRDENENSAIISGTIENVSKTILYDLEINGMLYVEKKETDLAYLVTDIFEEQKLEIDILRPTEIYEFSIELNVDNFSTEESHGIIFIQSPNSASKEVLQACYLN